MWNWILLTIGLFLGFISILVISIYQKRKSLALLSLIPLGLSFITGSISLYHILSKTYQKVAGKVEKAIEPRPGVAIYTDLFGNSNVSCIQVINSKDRVVPVVDCCIWLEFTTCPEEAARIIAQHPYQSTKLNKEGLRFAEPAVEEKPSWFAPASLGDSALAFKFTNPKGKTEELLFLSPDSTRGYYCNLRF
ncbi:hypothetical protein L0U88_10010 [Flavihumibacter sp. RY-1]|uniref:DUF4352 domain-containing protein n=1 Tax=Flavihumibacter fluminis TaxID=2909236 RepID=A0ABS9BIA1_9BACT|nr:hypothetical protein [Flavihumibacter fluminis]MCF1714960.1 hypothetical protein [Flavihumibacter fluminis]